MQLFAKSRAEVDYGTFKGLDLVKIQVHTYQYDCFDRRISKQVDTTPNDALEAARQWFAYDGANVRLELIDPDGSGAAPAILTTRYFNGLGVDNIIAQENYAGGDFTAGAYWHLKNHLGSTTDLVAHVDQGGHQNRIIYDSYGNVVSQSNASVGSRYMYTGREFDNETGLQYYRARYYDSSTGRFLSEDPVPASNMYSYVGNNPVNYIDPMGLREYPVGFIGPLQAGDTRRQGIWIENGAGGREPNAHESINVGDPKGNYDSVSFGMREFPRSSMGEIYKDDVQGGEILKYKEASETDANSFLDSLKKSIKKKKPYFPGASDCRAFSRGMFNQAPGKETAAPSRPLIRTPNTNPFPIFSTIMSGGLIQPYNPSRRILFPPVRRYP